MSEELEQQGAKPGNGQSHNPEDIKTDNLQHISHIGGMYQSWFLD